MSPIRSLFTHRRLLLTLVTRDVRTQIQGGVLGVAWIILNPLLMMFIYAFVFGVIFKARYNVVSSESGLDFTLGIFLSLSLYRLLADPMSMSPDLIVRNPNFVKKVVFPLETLPASTVGTALFQFAVSLLLVLVGVLVARGGIPLTALWLPVVVVPVVMMALGAAWLIAAIGVFLRDVRHVMQFVIQILLYGSAIFYSQANVPERFWTILQINPLVHAVELGRAIVLWGESPGISSILYLWVSAIVAIWIGWSSFRVLRPTFADAL